jgi:hypothetical protein
MLRTEIKTYKLESAKPATSDLKTTPRFDRTAAATLAEAGCEFGVSAVRVHQLFRQAGLPSRSAADARRLVVERRAARDRAIIARVEITRDVRSVAAEFSLSEDWVRQVLRRSAPHLLPAARNARVPRGYWTRERIIEAAKTWQRLYGKFPTATDWNPAAARRHGQRVRVERFEAGLWPYLNTVTREFGSWSAAVAAAAEDRDTKAHADDAHAGAEPQIGA